MNFFKSQLGRLKSVNSQAQAAVEEFLKGLGSVNRREAILHVTAKKREHPGLSDDELIDVLFDKVWMRSVLMGFAAGLPGGLIGISAGVAESLALYRTYSFLICCVGYIKDYPLFCTDEFGDHMAVLLAGKSVWNELAVKTGLRGKHKSKGKLTARNVAQSQLSLAKRVSLGVLRARILRRAATRAVPLIGGVAGAAFNWAEVQLLIRQAKTYFDTEDSAGLGF